MWSPPHVRALGLRRLVVVVVLRLLSLPSNRATAPFALPW